MEYVPQLCNRCSQISFESLACPTGADLSRAREAHKSNRVYPTFLPFRESFDQSKDVESQKVTIGCPDQVQKSSVSCQLCALIYDAITRGGGLPAVPEGDELIICVDPVFSYHGYLTDSRMGVEGNTEGRYFILKRLSVTVELASNSHTLAFFNHIAQPCKVGGISDNRSPFLFSPTSQDEMYFAGRKRPQTINLDWLKHWVQVCNGEHGDDCKLAEEQSQKLFMNLIRMVDVRHNCIRTFEAVNPTKIKFITLSYVWGKPQTLKLLKSNRSELKREGGVTQDKLPQTISDAIDVTRELGIDFIWIDALCIVQDDLDDLQYQISSVTSIYRAAVFTIIAACGNDCNSGLAGLRSGTRTSEQKEVVVIAPNDQHAGMSLVSTCKSRSYPFARFIGPTEDIYLSVWSTRAWTLQERVLSRRNLIFTDEQAAWVCDGAFFCEESYFEHPSLEHDSYVRTADKTPLRWTLVRKSPSAASFQTIDGAVLATSQQRFWEKYKTLVTWFTGRSFTYPGDAFDAFRGVTDALEHLSGDRFLWGHPRSRFGLSLFWVPTASAVPRRRTELTTLPMTNLNTRTTFPSWSWLGWMSQVFCSVGDDRRESETNEILPFHHTSGPLRIHPVYATNRFDQLSSVGDLKKGVERPSAVPWKPVDDSAVNTGDVMSEILGLTETRLQQLPDEHIIFFWASTAIFSLRSTKQQYSQTLEVVNVTEDSVGTVYRSETPQWKSVDGTSPTPCEFVAVGRRCIAELPEFPPVVLALQIVWDDSIAYRVSVSEIDEMAWLNAQPQWKLIALM